MPQRKHKLLLATNPAYWPSVGGSERVLESILLGVRKSFKDIVVFTDSTDKELVHNSIRIMPYSSEALQDFARKHTPDVYFPNMIHSRITFKNIEAVSAFSKKTVVNIIGGYAPDSPLEPRIKHLKKLEDFADAAIHVDALSTEYLIDRTINPRVKYRFISQGLDFKELLPFRKYVGKSEKPYFLYAHNLWSWKKPDVFIKEIAAKLPHMNFKILANDKTGDFIEQTVELAKEHPNIEVLLGLNRKDFLKTLAEASGVVSTSSIEGAQPNILLELGFLGVPYFSLCPGQNYGHYPHVEMFYSLEEMRARLTSLNTSVFTEKANELKLATEFFSSSRFDWQEIIEEYRKLFEEGL